MIKIINFHYKIQPSDNVINTTSRSSNWSKSLSPFFCGPCELYDGYVGQNCENSWQYSKLYSYYADDNGNPTDQYFRWAKAGWDSTYANRYPMGKGVKPLCSYWAGEKLTYVEARKKIYIPLYSAAVQKTNAFKRLQEEYEKDNNLMLLDFDAHNLTPGSFEYEDLWNNPSIKVGHAYVLAMLLEGKL